MSLLTIAQKVARQVGIAIPTTVIGNNDRNIVRLLGVLNDEGEELLARYRWQITTKEVTHTTVATESQGVITTIAPGIKWLHNDTMFNRDINYPILPQGDVSWQRSLANTSTGPYPRFRIRGGNLLFYPVATAGETVTFEYSSRYWCQSATLVAQDVWTDDDDTGILDEQLMALGARWRWKDMMGLEYSQNFDNYEKRVENAIARDGGKRRLIMSGQPSGGFQRDLLVEEGSWSLS